MRAVALTASLLIAPPLAAQSTNALDGPMPNTVILGANWQMTPAVDDCTLVHRDQNDRPNLIIASRRDGAKAVFGLILPPGASYATAMQLTVIAQATTRQQIGQITFIPHHDPQATVLMAQWPIFNLLPRLATATKLSFYRADNRLIDTVTFTGDNQAAAASFSQCLTAVGAQDAAPMPSPSSEHHAIDAGWVRQFGHGRCTLVRLTRQGNEFGFRYTAQDGMQTIYRVHNSPQLATSDSVSLHINLRRMTEDGSVVDTEQRDPVPTRHVMQGENVILYAPTSPGLVTNMTSARWNMVNISADASGFKSDQVNISGSAAAVAALSTCIQSLP